MGLEMPSEELLVSLDPLKEQWPCREPQLRQLNALLSPHLPSPPTLVAYGPQSTGKSNVIKSYLDASGQRNVTVQCQECVTGRHLLERTAAAVHQSLQTDAVNGDVEVYTGRCENISALVSHLQRMLQRVEKYVLVLDGIDRQREAPPTLLPALARLGEFVPKLTTIFVVRHAPPRFLHHPGVPHIHFPAYTRNQSIHILSKESLDIFEDSFPEDMDYDDETHAEDKEWLWPRFCAAVWDSLAQSCARDLSAFRDVCHKLWRPFIAPVIKGDFGTRDFSRLLVAQRKLFQDESALSDSIISTSTTETSIIKSKSHDLPYYAKYILLAAYLASSNPARLDQIYFMKSTERKRRKKGGGTARSGGGKPSQNRKLPRHLLAPSPLPLDRLLSILYAILPHDFRSTIDVYTQIATLSSLRLLVRAGGIGGGDPLEPGGKWKVGPAVSWEYVQNLARTLDFGLQDYIAD